MAKTAAKLALFSRTLLTRAAVCSPPAAWASAVPVRGLARGPDLEKTYDAAVVGIGAMGSSALFHLAKSGASCIGLEQFEPGHSRGSSHGDTRIIRLAYSEDPSYVPLLRRAYSLWGDLEARSGSRLLHITGSIDGGHEHLECFQGALRSAKEHALEHEVLTGAEVNRRFPGYSFPHNFKALFQPQGGFLESEAAIKTHVKIAAELGAEVRPGAAVKGWSVLPDGRVEVESEGGTAIRARRLVLTAGAWTSELVPQLKECVPERQVVAWFDIKDPRNFRQGSFPVFNIEDDTGRWYGFPQFGGPGFKIGRYHHLGETTSGDGLDREIHDKDIDLLWSGAGSKFCGLAKRVHKASACMFTNTPDEHFVLDTLPDHPQVVVCSACSGHGYKFASVVGEILSELAMTGGTQHDISLHRIAHPRRTGPRSVWDSSAAPSSQH